MDVSEEANNDIMVYSSGGGDIIEPTFSVVELGPPHSNRQRPARIETSERDHRSNPPYPMDEDNDDSTSIFSKDSMTPLLDEHN